jgi:CubicO group peptidase (beta-lactamase class C family)
MLLGFLLQDVRRAASSSGGRFDPSSALAAQFRRVAAFITIDPLAFNPPRTWRPRTAPTEHDEWRGRTLVGEVHDENTWALGGGAGHAGLFGSAPAVGAFAQSVLRTIAGERVLAHPSTFREFIRRTDIPGSSRAIGWDTMLPTSSCGTQMSRTAFGHVGFTGTSLWIDPNRDRYFVLLTNRACGGGSLDDMRTVRRSFHDALAEL